MRDDVVIHKFPPMSDSPRNTRKHRFSTACVRAEFIKPNEVTPIESIVYHLAAHRVFIPIWPIFISHNLPWRVNE